MTASNTKGSHLAAAGKSAPIGVFDSGLGGLTAVRELHHILPGEDIVYFGDTGRVPYGSRGKDTIIAYAGQDAAFLLSKGVKFVLAACGTVSSTWADADARQKLPVGYMGVVKPAAKAAALATKNGRVGIIGTEATVASGSYQKALARYSPEAECFAAACPLFVPLVENGHFQKGDALAALAAEEYLPAIRSAGVDTLIMGCTHYPLLAGAIADFFGPGVTLIDAGREAAAALSEKLREKGLLSENTAGGRLDCYVSDDTARFGRLAELFLMQNAAGPDAPARRAPAAAQRVAVEGYRL